MGGQAVQRAAGLPAESSFGPVFLLACRFTLGGIAWMLLFRPARRGWTWTSAARAVSVGLLLGVGLILQHVGLDRTSEAVSAFLTALTILFVPLLTTFAQGKPPRAILWFGVALATVGVAVMTGASPTGFGLGELLGLGCALAFSLYILAVNAAVASDVSWRITGGQFLTVGVACFAYSAALPNGLQLLQPSMIAEILAPRGVWINLLLLSCFATIGAFGLLTHFQPRLEPTRAALIYLMEPIMATLYATVAVHHHPAGGVLAGAACIIAANLGVEIRSAPVPRPDSGGPMDE